MTRIFDSLSGAISESALVATDEDAALINGLPNPPPVPVTPDDIYVRKCRLAGDGVNCHFGRFHTEDLPELLKKCQGVSCLIGHRKDTAGIARFFGGSVEEHTARSVVSGRQEEMRFIVPKIYWMKSHSQADNLRINIDGGIYHQASISWYFEKPVCGLCGRDIRLCDHVPGRIYDGSLCFFWYEEIGDVLEGSIVYSGGHPGTGFELADPAKERIQSQEKVFKLKSDGRLQKGDILPYFQNIESGSVYIIGGLADRGWTDHTIEVVPEPETAERVAGILPPYLADRLEIRETLPAPCACIKVNTGSSLEIESLPPFPGTCVTDRRTDSFQSETAPSVVLTGDSGEEVAFQFLPERVFCAPPEKIFSAEQSEMCPMPSMVFPHYDGAPVVIAAEELHESGGRNEKNKHARITVTIPAGYRAALPSFRDGVEAAVRELRAADFDAGEIRGELVGFRGRSRVELGSLPVSEKRLWENLRFVMKVYDYVGGETTGSDTLPGRLNRFSEAFGALPSIAPAPYRTAENLAELKSARQALNTRSGVTIVPAAIPRGDPAGRVFLSRRLVADVAVLAVRPKTNGWVYLGGVREDGQLEPVGATHITRVACSAGDVIRVEVESAEATGNRYSWQNPRVLGIRNSVETDTADVLRRMHALRCVETSGTNAGGAETAAQSPGGQTGFRLVEMKDRPGGQMTLDFPREGTREMFTVKEDAVDLMNRGFLCPGSWAENPCLGSRPVAGQNAADGEIIDSGGMTIVEWGARRRSGAFAGKKLHGIVHFRRIDTGGGAKWYVMKK